MSSDPRAASRNRDSGEINFASAFPLVRYAVLIASSTSACHQTGSTMKLNLTEEAVHRLSSNRVSTVSNQSQQAAKMTDEIEPIASENDTTRLSRPEISIARAEEHFDPREKPHNVPRIPHNYLQNRRSEPRDKGIACG
jgi:hypothetical protein